MFIHKILSALIAFALCLAMFFVLVEENAGLAGISVIIAAVFFIVSGRIRIRPGSWYE